MIALTVINMRFRASIMITGKNGRKRTETVEVKDRDGDVLVELHVPRA